MNLSFYGELRIFVAIIFVVLSSSVKFSIPN